VTNAHRTRRLPGRRPLVLTISATALALTLTACSSTASSPPTDSKASFTLDAASVPGVGKVLVNGAGRTFYILSSEAGGHLTCTDANGCTAVWPATVLPSGTTAGIAGSGIQAVMLGTIRHSEGKLYLTYGGWPLYTYTGDSGPHQSNGQGVSSFGGTWTAITAAGGPAVSAQ